MRILNIMLGKGKGGLEQAALDYHEALLLAGHTPISVIHPHSALRQSFLALGGDTLTLQQWGEWDLLSACRLRNRAKQHEADLAIAHGNRAIGVALRALKGHIPVIGVAHNYNIKKRFPKCDGAFSITRDILEDMVHLDMPRETLFHIPNMVRPENAAPRLPFRDPPVIGSMGRFVEKKGFDIYLHALKALHDQSIPFKALLGGDGVLANQLQQQARDFGLGDSIEFTGWVSDKNAFFDSIDIFVLPSQHEPFGIVLIEAMQKGLPCITTDSEGPCEIVTHERNAIMVEKARPYQLAQEIRALIESPERARTLGEAGARMVRETYDMAIVSARLDRAILLLTQPANPSEG